MIRTISAMCAIQGARKAIELYKELFGAVLLVSFEDNSNIVHAEVGIGDSVFMIGEPWGDHAYTMAVGLKVADARATWDRAIAAGCTEIYPLELQFYGDLAGRVRDPFGNQWAISTHVEDVSPREQGVRFHKMMRGESWK